MVVQQIEALIESGWRVANGNFGDWPVQQWRQSALECLSLMVGPDHTYTEHFATQQTELERMSVLTDVGVLTAARLWLSQGYGHGSKD